MTCGTFLNIPVYYYSLQQWVLLLRPYTLSFPPSSFSHVLQEKPSSVCTRVATRICSSSETDDTLYTRFLSISLVETSFFMMLLRGRRELCRGSSSCLLDHIKQTSAQASPNICNYLFQKKTSTLPQTCRPLHKTRPLSSLPRKRSRRKGQYL